MTENKTTNRGGKRVGAGRPTAAQQEAKAAASGTAADVRAAPIVVKNAEGKKIKLDVVSEIAKIYLELTNLTLTKEERAELKDRVGILKELLPYATSKRPIASLNESSDKKTTKIEISGFDLEDL